MNTEATKAKTTIRLTEEQLLSKGHAHIVAGSLRYDDLATKQKVTINTRNDSGEFDGNTREIATSDLHQCYWTEATKEEMDRTKRNQKAKDKRARTKANAPAPAQGEDVAVAGGAAALAAALG